MKPIRLVFPAACILILLAGAGPAKAQAALKGILPIYPGAQTRDWR